MCQGQYCQKCEQISFAKLLNHDYKSIQSIFQSINDIKKNFDIQQMRVKLNKLSFDYEKKLFQIAQKFIILNMPFYRNLGPISFQSENEHFQIFRAEPDTTIFQSKIQDVNQSLESLVQYYQLHLHNSQIHFYNENNKNSSIVIPQSKPILMNKISIDDFCKVLLEATKTVTQISLLFPQHIGALSSNHFRLINGKLVFLYFPISKLKDQFKSEAESVKGILSLAQKMKDQSNMSHKLLVKKLTKCKKMQQITQQINYFYSVYGIGTKSNKLSLEPKEKNKRQTKRKLNLFGSSKSKLPQDRISIYSRSMHNSAPRKDTSFHIGIPDKTNKMLKTASNSCSTRKSPYKKLKFKTINFSNHNLSFHSSEQKKVQSPKVRKSLKKIKMSGCEIYNAQVSISDQQKLLKKLNKKKMEVTSKKVEIIESFKQIKNFNQTSIKSEKQQVSNMKQDDFSKPFQQDIKLSIQYSPVSVKLPVNIDQPTAFIQQTRDIPSKTVLKHQSIHVSHSNIPIVSKINPLQPPPQIDSQLKKSKKKPIKQDQWGSQIQIIEFGQKSKQPRVSTNNKMNQTKQLTKQINDSRISIDKKDKQIQDGIQTRKNSWNIKIPQEKKINNKLNQLLQKKINLDYMGQTVVNTPGYLKNYQKIFWQLPLFFIYRSFYILRIKLSRQIMSLQDSQASKQLQQENEQIGVAVNKMAKMIMKKLKKQDPNILKNLKEFMNTDQNVNCDTPMKSLLGEYIQSLSQASSDYEELLKHEIEVVDSFLIAKGHQIDQKDKLKTPKDCQVYLTGQLQKLKSYM